MKKPAAKSSPKPARRAATPKRKIPVRPKTPAAKTAKVVKVAGTGNPDARSIDERVREAMEWLKSHATKATLDGMARYGIPSNHALGVTMADMKVLGKRLGRNHELAAALWDTGCYEARMVASMVDDPVQVTPAQMDRWCKDFDNWAICDTVCFNLFNRSPHAWAKIKPWSSKPAEFEKRTAFALLWCVHVPRGAHHNDRFLEALTFIEREAGDDRNFVKKAVNMALRATGRRNTVLHAAAVAVAKRLSGSSNKSARWVGSHALRELTSPAVLKRLKDR